MPPTPIDTTRPIAVTGATGYVAGVLIQQLLEAGLTVHATVRDPARTEKIKPLTRLADASPGTLKIFKADLLETGSFADALEGCQLVYHTASPFRLNVDDPQRDLVDPALHGTRNVLEQATESKTVKRVVVTSSVAAIYGDNIDLQSTPNKLFDETVWNTSSSLNHQPYSYSKTLAEKMAWQIAARQIAARQNQWDLVTINPSLVLGPGIHSNASSESLTLIRKFGDGSFRTGVPHYELGIVDIRDVAQAHREAGFRPEAQGRYLVSGHDTSFAEIGRILREHFGSAYPFPKKVLPKWIVWLVGPIIDPTLTRKIVAKNVGYPFRANNRKSVRELGLVYRPMEETICEMFQQLIDNGALAPPHS